VTMLRARAAELFAAGADTDADACLGRALGVVTSQLEALAAEAQALRTYRDARRQHSSDVGGGCVVDAAGATVCLSPVSAIETPPVITGTDVALPGSVGDCSSGAAAVTLMQRVQRGEHTLDGPALETGLVLAAHRHWWAAARATVDVLRGNSLTVSDDTRRSLTTLRDESASVLALLRQTRMDESTINCATLWAQGELSVHLNVKFALRLDAPVTVLNVDNEKVTINETHVSFSGVGRQKPKRYVMELELFAPIDPARSSWAFGSVGTIKFKLIKKTSADWRRLTKNSTTASKTRVWWEHQDKVEEEDRKIKADEAAAKKLQKEAAERDEKVAAEAAALASRVAKREIHLPLLETVEHTADVLAAIVGQGKEASTDAFAAAKAASAALLLGVGQAKNESATAYSTQLLAAVVSLGATGLGATAMATATAMAIASSVAQFKEWSASLVQPPEPEPELEAPPPKKKKRGEKKEKKEKKSKKKKPKGDGDQDGSAKKAPSAPKAPPPLSH